MMARGAEGGEEKRDGTIAVKSRAKGQKIRETIRANEEI